MQQIICRVGERWLTNEGYWVTIVEYFNNTNCTVRFEDGTEVRGKEYRDIKKGKVKNPYHRSVCGVGYHGQGKYSSIDENGKNGMIYTKWNSMIKRCYSKKSIEHRPTYQVCTVDERWHNLQVFGAWYEENFKPHMQDWELDKDILEKGNKIYSPETCGLVPQEINTLFIKSNKIRGEYPIGVYKNPGGGKKFKVCSPFKDGSDKYCDSIEEAFQTYKIDKEQHIKNKADEWKDKIALNIYEAMYNYPVEITD